MATLYELTSEYQQLYDMATGDYEDEVFMDTLEGLVGEIEIKAEGYGKVIRQIESDIENVDAEIARLKERKDKFKARRDKLKETLLNSMKTMDMKHINTSLFSFTWKINPPAVVLHVKDEEIDEKYKVEKVTTSVSKTLIKEAILKGEHVYGATLEQSSSLVMK